PPPWPQAALAGMIGAGYRLNAEELSVIPGSTFMAIEVRIPTILRTYTDGAKQVEGAGGTLAELLADLESRHAGLQARLIDGGTLRRFGNVSLNDEDVRFLDGLDPPVKEGDTLTVLPAVAGGALDALR